MKKRVSGIFTSLLLVLSMVSVLPVMTASAETSGDYEYVELDDGTIEITKYTGTDSVVEIPSEIDGKTVTSIANKPNPRADVPGNQSRIGAFEGCTATEIIVPDTVETIGMYCFNNCPNLKKLQLSNNLKSIDYCGVFNCSKLTSLVVPKSVTELKMYAIGYAGGWWYPDAAENFVIKCYTNSAAHQYAIDNGFAYELLDESVDELKYQFRENEDGTTDLRFILIADEADVLAADSAQFYATIDGTDTDSVSINRAYRSIIAGTKKITADEGKVFLIGKLLDVPEDMIYSVVAHFTLGEKTFSRVVRHVVTNGEILWQGSADLLKWKTGQNISLENNNNFRYGDTLFIDATPIDESASGSLAVYAVVEEDGEDVAYDLYNLEGEPEIYSVEAKTTVRVPLDEESIQTLNKAKELIVNGSNVNISKVSYIIV